MLQLYIVIYNHWVQSAPLETKKREKKERGVTTETKCFSFYGGEAILTFYNYKQSFFSYKTAIASPLWIKKKLKRTTVQFP